MDDKITAWIVLVVSLLILGLTFSIATGGALLSDSGGDTELDGHKFISSGEVEVDPGVPGFGTFGDSEFEDGSVDTNVAKCDSSGFFSLGDWLVPDAEGGNVVLVGFLSTGEREVLDSVDYGSNFGENPKFTVRSACIGNVEKVDIVLLNDDEAELDRKTVWTRGGSS